MPLSPVVIAIVVMVVVVLGAVGFLLFKSSDDKTETEDEEVVETVTVSGADAASCNKLGYYSNSSPNTCTAIDSTSCKSFIDTAKAGMNPKPEGDYTELWCKTKYATLSTKSAFCVNSSNAFDTYVKSLATKFNAIKLIKATQGTTATYYYDSTSTTANPSPSTLTVLAIETGTYKTANTKGTDDIIKLLRTSEFNNFGWQLQTYVIEHVSAALGITTNIDAVVYDSISREWKKSATALTGTNIRKYTVVPSVWTTIGPGATHTYSYLNLTTTAQTALLNELKGAVGGFGKYCA